VTEARIRAYVGLGSNLDDPLNQLRQALRELDGLARVRLAGVSSLYRSTPMGPADQPDYLNAVAALDTSLDADDLLVLLQGIEEFHHRVRGEHWGPRTLDLDLLLYGDQCIDTEHLRVPHQGLHERNFVLYPLAEIAPPDLAVPGLGPLQELLAHCPDTGLRRLDESLP
jgi:2-amino-4-hydroxy-6-hydroxymethyldihydropteridine diphosphokinase